MRAPFSLSIVDRQPHNSTNALIPKQSLTVDSVRFKIVIHISVDSLTSSTWGNCLSITYVLEHADPVISLLDFHWLVTLSNGMNVFSITARHVKPTIRIIIYNIQIGLVIFEDVFLINMIF